MSTEKRISLFRRTFSRSSYSVPIPAQPSEGKAALALESKLFRSRKIIDSKLQKLTPIQEDIALIARN